MFLVNQPDAGKHENGRERGWRLSEREARGREPERGENEVEKDMMEEEA